ncbi:T9SS type A sorting domain-containing protein [Tannerella forsythia]|uniref:T9SS type A sorting domain-containing protein n=1 Tax=Tannerella forsythia TaxID=28112 RepID=UPI0028DAF973|nr:T9SS type A sorting domain-containing protein [Tannerella forsythia]
MKKILFTAIFLSVYILGTHGQVETTFFPNRDALQQNRLLKEHRRVAKIKAMPPLDIQKIASARQQEKDDNVPFRFGEGFDTHITLADGEWTDRESGRLWTMAIESKGAYSINFVFNDFHLPEGAELYISNEEGDMLYGPVTSKVNTENGHFLTDLIKGDKVTIYLFEPSNKRNESQLTIKRVVHAYENMFSDMAYGQIGSSGNCNNNVACFPAWSKESDAVALVLLSNGTEWCSGSLLMTANQSFRPYFLSAFHCIDTDIPKGSLSSSEISNAENWMFKFQYKMSSCSGGYATSGVTYNRATFRAAWNNTDFALMELRNSPAGDSRFSWLGWDRSGNAPTAGTGIHHPSGDVMKISFDNDLITETAAGSTNSGTTHWFVDIDNGTLEHGSSGSPLFNPQKKVIGQLHNGYPGCNSSKQFWYGCFHRSWAGGGTNSTRLSNWLDPNGSGVITTNTSKSPTVSGPSSVCDQATYTVENLPAGAIVEWSVSNPNVATISNNGVLQVTNQTFALTNIQANIFTGGENPYTIRKERVMTGQPKFEIQPLGYSGSNFASFFLTPQGEYGDLQSIPLNYRWSYTKIDGSGYTLIGDYQNTSFLNIEPVVTFPGPGTYMITVQITGYPCYIPLVRYKHSCGSNFFTLSPNPATDEVTLQLMETDEVSGLSVLSTDRSAYEIQIWSGMRMLRSFRTNEPTFQIPMAGLPAGLYFVRVVKDGQTYTQKLIKK